MPHRLLSLAALLAAALLTTACGGDSGSGVDGSKKLSALSQSDARTFCAWALDTLGGPGHVTDCGGGRSREVDELDECIEDFTSFSSSCTATISQVEACIEASADDQCGKHPECNVLAGCD
jgi:hypothetical protein